MLVNKGSLVFYVVQKVLGLAPYMLSNEKYFVSQYMNLYTLICMCLMSVYIILGLNKIVMIPGKVFDSYITISCSTLTLLHIMVRQLSAVNANNEIVSISAALEKYTNINYLKLLVMRILEFIFSLGLVSGISIFLVESSKRSEWFSCMGMIYAMLVRLLCVNQFLWMAYTVRINATALNELLDDEKIYMSEDLIEVADLQERVTACAENTNSAFSFPLLCWSIESFAKICYSTYHLTICILYTKFPTCGPEKKESFFTFLWYLLQLWYIVALCQMTTITVTNTAIKIHKIIRNVKRDDPAMERLEMFSFQLSPKFNFTAAGFFTIDYSFLTTLAGLVTTYVIIFVQFFVIDNSGDSTPNDRSALEILGKLV